MPAAESKSEYIARAKALLRADLRQKTWEEKVRAMERMNAMQREWRADSKQRSEGT
jgi:hypothetical protein